MGRLQNFAFWLNEKVNPLWRCWWWGIADLSCFFFLFVCFSPSVTLHVSFFFVLFFHPVKQQLLLHIMAAKIASKLDESQAGRQLEALRQPGRRTVLWMSFCQTQSQARFVFDNSIKASFSRRRRVFFFNVCCWVVFFLKNAIADTCQL